MEQNLDHSLTMKGKAKISKDLKNLKSQEEHKK